MAYGFLKIRARKTAAHSLVCKCITCGLKNVYFGFGWKSFSARRPELEDLVLNSFKPNFLNPIFRVIQPYFCYWNFCYWRIGHEVIAWVSKHPAYKLIKFSTEARFSQYYWKFCSCVNSASVPVCCKCNMTPEEENRPIINFVCVCEILNLSRNKPGMNQP